MGAEHRSKCCNTKIDLRKKGSSINCIKQREITAISMTKIIVIWSYGICIHVYVNMPRGPHGRLANVALCAILFT